MADEINDNHLATWDIYYDAFKPLEDAGSITLPTIPEEYVHNAHIFHMKTKDFETRRAYNKFMKENEILCVFHYVSVHSAPIGLKNGRFVEKEKHTTSDSNRLVRLPMFYNNDMNDFKKVIDKPREFFAY